MLKVASDFPLSSISEQTRTLDELAQLARLICQTSHSAVVLADASWPSVGRAVAPQARAISLEIWLSAHSLLDLEETFVVTDVKLDSRFSTAPSAHGDPIRFFAGAPLVDSHGAALGVVYVHDQHPRDLSAAQRDALAKLARQASRTIELSRQVTLLTFQKTAFDRHAVVLVANADGKLIDVNEAFCALSLYSREELLSLDASLFATSRPGSEFFSEASIAAADGAAWQGLVRGRARNGSEYWIQTTVIAIKSDPKSPVLYVAVGTDITERKRSEETLRRNERWLQGVLEALPAAIYTTDAQGLITFFNPAAVEFSGRVPNLGSDSWCVTAKLFETDGTPLSHEECPMALALKQGRPIRGTQAIAERPDGTRVHFIPFPTPIRDDAGELLGAVNMLVDITAQKRDEESLRLLGSALEQANESILITDAELDAPGPRIVFANAAFTTLTGYTFDDVKGKTPRLGQGPLSDRTVLKRLRETLARGETFQGEIINYRKDGTPFDLEWHVAPVRDTRGVVTHFVAVQRDVTERNTTEATLTRAREEALDSVRRKSRFLANLSHELRTPLNTINGLSATLLEQPDLPTQAKKAAALILQCGETLLENIQTILTHSSLDAGKTKLHPKPFRPCDVVLSALRISQPAAQRKGIELDYTLSASLPSEMVGDPFRLQQILINLLANAVKFTDKGRVCLHVRARPNASGEWQLRFAVADTGIGIAQKTLAQLFKPFSQADDGSGRRLEGTGLGLAITKTLVELMGGEISVGSRLGCGSLFRFALALPAVERSRSVFAPFAHPRLAGKNVLIIEPDRIRARQWLALAKSWAAEATVVKDTATAQAYAIGNRVDIRIQVPPLSNASRDLFSSPSPVPVLWFSHQGQSAPLPSAGQASAVIYAPLDPNELSVALLSLLSHKPGDPSELDRPATSPAARVKPLGERLPLRILAADDIRTNRDLLVMMCQHLGYKIDLCENGADVLERLKTKRYDLLLTDIQMPVLDGIAMAKELFQRYPDPATRPRIVAVTAGASPGSREHCLEIGFNDYLTKPILPKHLQACIEQLFGSNVAAPVKSIAPVAVEEMPSVWVDLTHLQAATDGLDTETACDLLTQLFLATKNDFSALRPRLAQASVNRDVKEMIAVVHGLKGCVLSLGWTHMGERCGNVLHALKDGTFQGWTTLLPELDELYRTSASEFELVIGSMKPGAVAAMNRRQDSGVMSE